MEELIYLLVKLIAGAMSGSKARQQAPPVDLAWQQRVWEQQRLMQQAALLASRGKQAVAPPAPPRPIPAPVRRAAFSESTWTDAAQISRKDAGEGMRPEALTKLIEPNNLRRRFVLTEILRPPVSLRPPRI